MNRIEDVKQAENSSRLAQNREKLTSFVNNFEKILNVIFDRRSAFLAFHQRLAFWRSYQLVNLKHNIIDLFNFFVQQQESNKENNFSVDEIHAKLVKMHMQRLVDSVVAGSFEKLFSKIDKMILFFTVNEMHRFLNEITLFLDSALLFAKQASGEAVQLQMPITLKHPFKPIPVLCISEQTFLKKSNRSESKNLNDTSLYDDVLLGLSGINLHLLPGISVVFENLLFLQETTRDDLSNFVTYDEEADVNDAVTAFVTTVHDYFHVIRKEKLPNVTSHNYLNEIEKLFYNFPPLAPLISTKFESEINFDLPLSRTLQILRILLEILKNESETANIFVEKIIEVVMPCTPKDISYILFRWHFPFIPAVVLGILPHLYEILCVRGNISNLIFLLRSHLQRRETVEKEILLSSLILLGYSVCNIPHFNRSEAVTDEVSFKKTLRNVNFDSMQDHLRLVTYRTNKLYALQYWRNTGGGEGLKNQERSLERACFVYTALQ